MRTKLAVVVFTLSGVVSLYLIRPWLEKGGSVSPASQLELRGDEELRADHSQENATQPPVPAGGPVAITPRRVKMVTSEAEMEKLMRRAVESSVGEIQLVEGRLQKLVVDGKELLKGYQLSNATGAKNGSVAVASYDSDRKGIDDADIDSDFRDGKLQVSTAAVWLLQAGGKERISLANMHADYPCIAPDGMRVAYTGRALNEKGMPSRQRLYVYNTRSKQTTILDVDHPGRVAPLYWEGETLAVYTGALESSFAAVTYFKVPADPVAAR